MKETMSSIASKKRQSMVLVVVALCALMVAAPLSAVPPPGKGGGNGGGGGGTPTAAEHFEWRVSLPGSYSLVRPSVGPDGTIYAVDVADNLYAVAPDGTVKWTAADAGSKGLDVGPDGTIYTGNEDWVKAFNPDGGVKWTFVQQPRAFVFIDVTVGPDGHIYGVASSGLGVFSLEDLGSDAALRWTNPEPYSRLFVGYTEIEFGPTADGQDQQLYFYANGHTRAVRLSDGASVFTLGGGNTIPRVSPLDGTWHRPATAHAPDGAEVWAFEFPLATGSTEPELSASGNHYTVNSGNVLYSIDPDGRENWQNNVGEFVGTPNVDPTEAVVLLPIGRTANERAALKAVSTRNGGDLWRMEFPESETGLEQFVSSKVAFSAGGDRAYVMTSNYGGTGAHAYLNAVATDAGTPSASTLLRSSDITIDAKSRRNAVTFTGTVAVTDENLASVSGAAVSVTWTLPDGTTVDQTATSNGKGEAKFTYSGEGGLYQLTVTAIALDGYVFDPANSVLEAAKAWF